MLDGAMPTSFSAESKNTHSTDGSGRMSHTAMRCAFLGTCTTLSLWSVTVMKSASGSVVSSSAGDSGPACSVCSAGAASSVCAGSVDASDCAGAAGAQPLRSSSASSRQIRDLNCFMMIFLSCKKF